jgi:amidase
VTGQPAVSLPCRRVSQSDVPIGIQLIGRYGGEAELFTLAAAYERAAPWGHRRPNSAPVPNRARVQRRSP